MQMSARCERAKRGNGNISISMQSTGNIQNMRCNAANEHNHNNELTRSISLFRLRRSTKLKFHKMNQNIELQSEKQTHVCAPKTNERCPVTTQKTNTSNPRNDNNQSDKPLYTTCPAQRETSESIEFCPLRLSHDPTRNCMKYRRTLV